MISLLGSTLGVLINLGNLSGLDQPVDGLGTTDGVADGRLRPSATKTTLEASTSSTPALLNSSSMSSSVTSSLSSAGQGVEGEGLASDVVSLMVQFGDECLGGQAVGGQPGVQGHAASGEVLQEVLTQLGEDGLLVVLVDLVELKTLGQLGDNAGTLLESGELGGLVGLDLELDGVAHGVDAVEAEGLLDELIGQLGDLTPP